MWSYKVHTLWIFYVTLLMLCWYAQDMNQVYLFQDYLKEELERRCFANNNYSLRSFAKSLECDPSYLSKVLNGKKNISRHFIKRISHKLNLPQEVVDQFVAQNVFGLTDPQKQPYDFIEYDKFQLISHWYYDAILELSKLSFHVADPKWIAQVLELSPNQVEAALERLIQFKMLKIKNNKLIDLTNGHTTNIKSSASTSLANRNYQKEILFKSIAALEGQNIEHRDHTSIMMVTNSKKISQAKKKIKDFRRQLCKFLEDCDEYDQVYQVSISLFPILNKNKPEKSDD